MDESKLTNLPKGFGFSSTKKSLFKYTAKISYNSLPKKLTQIDTLLFKSWQKNQKNTKIKIPSPFEFQLFNNAHFNYSCRV